MMLFALLYKISFDALARETLSLTKPALDYADLRNKLAQLDVLINCKGILFGDGRGNQTLMRFAPDSGLGRVYSS
jgi:hypothetical protein